MLERHKSQCHFWAVGNYSKTRLGRSFERTDTKPMLDASLVMWLSMCLQLARMQGEEQAGAAQPHVPDGAGLPRLTSRVFKSQNHGLSRAEDTLSKLGKEWGS